MSTKDHKNNLVDELLKEAIQSAPLEKPGDDFITNLMEKVDQIDTVKSVAIKAEPTISTKGWVLIFSIIAVVFTLIFIVGQTGQSFPLLSGWYSKISLDFTSVSVPNLFVEGMVAFLVFFVLEILVITRKYTGKRVSGI